MPVFAVLFAWGEIFRRREGMRNLFVEQRNGM
jgi:hypothetical protein